MKIIGVAREKLDGNKIFPLANLQLDDLMVIYRFLRNPTSRARRKTANLDNGEKGDVSIFITAFCRFAAAAERIQNGQPRAVK